MGNIFADAKFGDKFMTRDNREALYIGLADLNKYLLWVRERDIEAYGDIKYDKNGKCGDNYVNSERYDIVSKCDHEAPAYTYEQMATLNLQLQGLITAKDEAYNKIKAENEYLRMQLRLIRKVLNDE